MNDPVISEVEPQIPSNTLDVKAPSDSQESNEEVESPEAPSSEGEAILGSGPRRTGQVRQSPTWYTSRFEPASEWVANHAQTLFSAIKDSDFSFEDWEEIKALMCELGTEIMHQHPSSTYQDFVALAASKNDPDTPSFKEALSGDYASEFKTAIKKEIEALQKRNT
eukprot:12615597-Ditylum_brightwellii.AAC.1